MKMRHVVWASPELTLRAPSRVRSASPIEATSTVRNILVSSSTVDLTRVVPIRRSPEIRHTLPGTIDTSGGLMARRGESKKAKARVAGPMADQVREALGKITGAERAGLFPPHIDKVREITSLELRPEDADTYSALIESIC